MKIVKTTDTSLNIIPREYPSDVSVSIRGESTNKTTTFETPVTTSGGYLNVPYSFSFIENNFYDLEVSTISQSGGVKCIAANNEYLSSPAGNYFGNTVDGIDIEIEYENYVFENQLVPILSQGYSNGDWVVIQHTPTGIQLSIRTGGVTTNTYNTIITLPIKGKIRYNVTGGNVLFYVDDVLMDTIPQVGSNDFTTLSSNSLLFATQSQTADPPLLVFYKSMAFIRIKINNHEWTFPEGTGSTTTNSQGVVTTLFSDGSTDDMIIQEQEGTRIYKGKIFCTDQDNYSINNGKYVGRSVQREYITR